MTIYETCPITVGEPNWAPLETGPSAARMRRLHVHGPCWGDRVVQACPHAPLPQHQCGRPAVLPATAYEYIEITKAVALDHVRN